MSFQHGAGGSGGGSQKYKDARAYSGVRSKGGPMLPVKVLELNLCGPGVRSEVKKSILKEGEELGKVKVGKKAMREGGT